MTEVTKNMERVDPANRKTAYDALAASEARYRRLFESARDGILILDVDTGKIVDVNPYLTELTGFSREDFLDKHLWEIGPFKDIAAGKESFAELQDKEYVRYEDLPLATLDGKSVSVEFISNVYLVDRQKVIQCNIRDISDRKRTEEKLWKSEQKLVGIMANMRDVVWSLSWPDLKVLFISDSAERIFGRPAQDFQAHPSLWRETVHPKDKHTIETAFNDLQKLGSAERKCRIVRPDESIAWIHDRSWMIFDESGRTIRVDGIVTEITKHVRAEAEREKLEKQLWDAQKMEAIGSLAGGVAHDFNNLLTVILSYTEFAMDALREDDSLLSDLGEIKKAGELAAALTRQLLAFGRKQMLQPVPLSLNTIAAGVEKMLQRILGEDIHFVLTFAPDLGLTTADPSQIEQVLMNLVVNARDAMPEGGKLTIKTSNIEIDDEYAARHVAVKPGSYVQLTVSDTGCGMDEQTQVRIFEPFFTTKKKGKGTGLGLSTTYGIVKQSGGDIWVYSELGHGTTFKIYLPRELSVTAPAVINPLAAPKSIMGSETILVVEDEEALLRLSLRTLKAAGYRVLTAANGEEALLVSAQHTSDIHLLLTDVVMPLMNGRALAQALSKERPALKILYMSGYTGDAIVQHGVLDANTHFLAKPFTAADMTRKVRAVLDGGITNHADKPKPAAMNRPEVKEAQPLDNAAALRGLPRDLLKKAYRAVTAARYDNLVELIETLRMTKPDPAAELRRMADAYDYDGLRNVLSWSDGKGNGVEIHKAEGKSVLVVDDEPDNLGLLSEVLRRGNLVPRPVPSGRLAIEAAVIDPPDLVLLDICMPNMSGVEVCRWFKQDERLRSIPIIFISGLQGTDDKVEAFRVGAVDYITRPFQEKEVLARIKTQLRLSVLQVELVSHSAELERRITEQVKAVTASQLATIFALAKLAEARDDDTGHHIERVQTFSKMLAVQMREMRLHSAKLTAAFIDNLYQTASLHDIGKVSVPDAILLKTGKLTTAEITEMNKHCALGADTLAKVLKRHPDNQFLRMGVEVARSHHEKWDGSGYPNGLKGAAIPLAARIVALADFYDALTSDRCYRPKFGHKETCRMIQKGSGTHFDPDVVTAFGTLEGRFRKIRRQMNKQ